MAKVFEFQGRLVNVTQVDGFNFGEISTYEIRVNGKGKLPIIKGDSKGLESEAVKHAQKLISDAHEAFERKLSDSELVILERVEARKARLRAKEL